MDDNRVKSYRLRLFIYFVIFSLSIVDRQHMRLDYSMGSVILLIITSYLLAFVINDFVLPHFPLTRNAIERWFE